MVYIGDNYPWTFCRKHMRDKRLLVKINKIIFLVLPVYIFFGCNIL